MVGEDGVEAEALGEVLGGLEAADVLHEVEVAVSVDASPDHSVPVNALQLDVRIVLLELKVESLAKVDVWAFDGMEVFSGHLELSELEVLGEHFHFDYFNNYINLK